MYDFLSLKIHSGFFGEQYLVIYTEIIEQE